MFFIKIRYYDYSKVEYINSETKVCIICPKHGEFWQTPHNHLHGQGCMKCYDERRGDTLRLSNSEFLEMAMKTHGDTYSYERSEYKGMLESITITCKIHGDFIQTPLKHIHGKHGCPLCKQSKLEAEVREFLRRHEIDFKQGYRSEWLGKQHLDFYLPNYKVGIECQGEQHYKPISFNGDKNSESKEKNYVTIKERDERKRQLCKENNVSLFYYTHYRDAEEDETTFKDKDRLLNVALTRKCDND